MLGEDGSAVQWGGVFLLMMISAGSVHSGPSRMPESRSRLDVGTIVYVFTDVRRFVSTLWRPQARLAAENLFLRKQLALYLERQIKPRRVDTIWQRVSACNDSVFRLDFAKFPRENWRV